MTIRVAIGPSSFGDEDATPLKLLEDAGVTVVPNPFGRRLTEDEVICHLADVDGLIAGLEPLNRKVLGSARDTLKAIARVGIGMENVDVSAARELGIKVSNTPDEPASAVAEMTLAALLALGRGLITSNAALHQGEWRKSIGVGLNGSKVLIAGYGRIGRQVADLVGGLGAEVLVADPFLKQADVGVGGRLMPLSEGLRIADVISLHVAGSELLLGPEEFEIMKDGVILLNSARAGLVDESALIGGLTMGKVRGAWLDVFWQEPYKGRLCEFPQVLLTPHIATYTRQCRLAMETVATQNLLRDLSIIE